MGAINRLLRSLQIIKVGNKTFKLVIVIRMTEIDFYLHL